MTSIDIILIKVCPILGLILLGVALRSLRVIPPAAVSGMKKLVLTVCLPATVFQAMMGVKLGSDNLMLFGVVYAMWGLLLVSGFVLKRLPRYRSNYFPILLSSSEGGMLGYAFFAVLYGTGKVFDFAAVNLGNTLYFNTLALIVLLKYKEAAGGAKTLLKIVFTSPMVLAVLFGVLLGNVGAESWMSATLAGEAAAEFLRQAAMPTVPLIGIAIGYEMNLHPDRWLRPALTVLVRLSLVLPLGAAIDWFLLRGLLHADPLVQAAFAIMLILPPAFVLPLFIRDDNLMDKEYVHNTLTLGTLATLPMFIGVSLLFPVS